ncbi:hypothetical protein [Marinomonas spartinae]|uniref:hypothetical protein n=1 Tax=Marinomonas spartinae TaxID=1792290 RepID=UPI0018F252C5|nr:hypothetical protein [Marinomonas spartinae]MBJ7554968.1 hypothetical protein [Marinomonas spartinae]
MNDVNSVESMTDISTSDGVQWDVDEKYRNSLSRDCLCALIIQSLDFVNVMNARL